MPTKQLTQQHASWAKKCGFFDFVIVASFTGWRHYLEGDPNQLEVMVYINHENFKSSMTTKQLIQK